jgi:hypothetical protein
MKPIQAYSHLERSPALEASVLAPAAGVAAYYGSDLVARAMIGMTLLGKDTAAKEKAYADMKEGGGYKTFRNVVTGLGAAAGAAYPMIKNYNSKRSFGDNVSKFINRDKFYKDNPEALAQENADALAGPPQAVKNYLPGSGFASGRSFQKESSDNSTVSMWASVFSEMDSKSGIADLYEQLDKQASSGEDISTSLMDDIAEHCWYKSLDKEAFYSANSTANEQAQYTFDQEVIPVNQGRALIQRDPFLTQHNKARVDYLLRNAGEGDSGSISGHDLATTAVKAGIGIAAGIAFGKTMGNLFSMNTAQTDRLSNIGAFAGALYNTGVFK